MRHAKLKIGAVAVLLAAVAFLAGRLSACAPPASACPELDAIDPSFKALSVEELTRRFRESWLLPPSTADKQLDAIRASADVYVPERRACMVRVSLVHAIAGQEQARRTTPSLWGLGYSSEELRSLYLSLPLRTEYSADQRLDVIAQVEENVLRGLAAVSEADVDHWRRQYFGLLVVCEATDESLARLKATRPAEGDCLRFKPRAAQHDPLPIEAPRRLEPRPRRPGGRDPTEVF